MQLKKEETRTLQVVIPAEIAERLRKIAEEKDSSISRIIRSAIRLYLTKIESVASGSGCPPFYPPQNWGGGQGAITAFSEGQKLRPADSKEELEIEK